MSMRTTSIYAASRLINAEATAGPCEIHVDSGRIQAITPLETSSIAETCHIAVPGFIDMHTHGGAGYDVMDGDNRSLSRIARHHLKNGTTSFLGSTTTAPVSELARVLEAARTVMNDNTQGAANAKEASLLGVHVEGPWISPERAGAQNPSYMHAPDDAALLFVREYADVIRMVTFSYHYPTADDLLSLLLELNIIAACGHDQTTDQRILEGFARGLRHITHLYSMTSAFGRVGGYKHLGTLEMALMTPGVKVEVIADGKHITEYFWRFIAHNKDPKDIIIVSDSMRWAGMPEDPDRVHKLGDMDVIVDDGVAWLADRSAFAGSVGTMHAMFRRLVLEWGVDFQSAVQMTSTNQADELGLSGSLGSIAPGMAADFVLLDEDLQIVRVVKAGKLVR